MSDQAAKQLDSPLAPAESPALIAHLNMMQAVITRLAGNSVQCKTWCVAIVSALFGLAGATKSGRIAVAAIIPIIVFGFVDAAYLANERPTATCTTESSRKSGVAPTVSPIMAI